MLILFEYSTARETTFSFCRRPEKMVFPKKLQWNFMYYQERWYFIFPEIWSYPLNEKKISKKTYDLKKKYIWYFLQMFWKDCLFKKIDLVYFFFYYLERSNFFSWKRDIFPLDGRRKKVLLKKYMEVRYFL